MKLTSDTRVYIAGCGGMLGDSVYATFSKLTKVVATDIAITEPWLTYADVRDYHAMRKSILDFRPQVIINLAALTDLEHCEREQENAWLTNALGAENLGLIANEIDAAYVYVSTAGIYDGALPVYNDFIPPNPLSVYGKSKFHGESWVCRSVRKHFVPRAGWMMGGGPTKDKKFINKIFKQIVGGAKELFVVDDKEGTPTYTVDFAAGIVRLLESDVYGLYNHSGQGSCSRLDVAREFVRLLGLENRIKVTTVDSSYFAKEYFAVRPASEALTNLKLQARNFPPMRGWRECLADYAPRFKRELQLTP